MALQGNSVFLSSVTDLARKTQLAIELYPHSFHRVEPFLKLLIDDQSGQPKTGMNHVLVEDLETIILCEHERREGVTESLYKGTSKLDLYRESLLARPEWKQDWEQIKTQFQIEKFQ